MSFGAEVQGTSEELTPKVPPTIEHLAATAPAAFDSIYDDHVPLLRAIARRKFNVPEADIDCLVHDVFASFLISAPRVRDLRPYLVGGICNASRNYWRRRQRDDSLFTEIDENAVCDENV